MRYSVIIPVSNGAALTRSCLDALLVQKLADAEIVVVDDGSVDETQRVLNDYAAAISVVRLNDRNGFAVACNAGAEASHGELLVFLNNDTLPLDGWLGALDAEADEHPNAAAIGARLLFPDGTVQHAGVAFRENEVPFHIYRGLRGTHPAVLRSRPMQAVTGACMLVPRRPFEQAGGFDTAYQNGFEDIDLCLRFGLAGYEVRYCAQSTLIHGESATRGLGDPAINAELQELFRGRWRGRVRHDELSLYVEDGLIRLDHTDRLPVLSVSPLVASARLEESDGELERHLVVSASTVHSLREENARLRAAHRRPALAYGVGSDGRLVAAPVALRRDPPSHAGLVTVDALERLIAPLAVDVDPRAPVRLNLLVGELDAGHSDATMRGVLALAAALSARGQNVRLVVLDRAPQLGERSLRELGGGALELEAVAIAERPHAGRALTVSPADGFVATSWSSAHVAHGAVAQLAGERFAYLIGGYEPDRYPAGAFAAAAAAAYGLPHDAIFTDESLAEWFRERRLSVFSPAAMAGGARSVIVEPAIVDLGPPRRPHLEHLPPRRLLFHSRPPASGSATLFELGYRGLCDAIEAGAFIGEWRFTGLGFSSSDGRLPLPGERWLRAVPRLDPGGYRALLRGHDLGMALLAAPQVGLVPIEMAAAGQPVVTTCWANKDAQRLRAISSNLIGVDASRAAVRDGLIEAVARVDDLDARLSGASVKWNRSLAETFAGEAGELDRWFPAQP